MKLKTLPLKDPDNIKESLSYKIGDSGTVPPYDNTMEIPSGTNGTTVPFSNIAAYCKQWFKLILGLTTNSASPTAPALHLPNGESNMHVVKDSSENKAVFYNPSFNSAVRKSANVQFNHMFPLKASDEYSDGATGMIGIIEKNQRLRKGIFLQPDKDRKKTLEPQKSKPEAPSTSEINEKEALRTETEQLARICSWEYNAETKKFLCTDFVHTLLQIPAEKTVISFLSFLPFFAEEDKAKLTIGWNQALSNGKELNCVTRLRHVQENTWIRLRMKPIFKNDKLLKVVGTLQDVTDSVETEKKLITEKEKAEQATKVKSEFVSLMSHEIRTPLNAIMGLTYLLLQEENLAQEHKENLQSIHFSSQNMLALINNTLDLSRIEAGKIELEKVNFQLTDLLKKIHRSLCIRASEKQLEFHLNIDKNTPSEVAGDPARLTQVLNNLMSNAIKFTKKGSVSLSVEVVYQSDADWVLEFTVADTGVGIPEDRQQQIFESFVQASAATHRQYGGTGLGLAITKKIVELQNGSIELKSKPGAGSEFKVRLRFVKPDVSLDSLKVVEPTEKSDSALKDTKVLVIDDNIINNMVASKLLISWEANVDTAGDGYAALEKIKEKAYDLILMDLHMPVLNGFDAIAEIRRLGYTMPIIALTANASEDEKRRILAIGGNDYLTKPFVPQDLHDKMQAHLQPLCY